MVVLQLSTFVNDEQRMPHVMICTWHHSVRTVSDTEEGIIWVLTETNAMDESKKINRRENMQSNARAIKL